MAIKVLLFHTVLKKVTEKKSAFPDGMGLSLKLV
jgi:hypothetical protein